MKAPFSLRRDGPHIRRPGMRRRGRHSREHFVAAAPVSLNAGETKVSHAVPLAAESKYDIRELGACLGKVGLIEPGYASDTFPSGSTRAGYESVEAMDFTL